MTHRKFPRNMADKIGDLLVGEDGPLLVIDPEWTDEEVGEEWDSAVGDDPATPVRRVIRHRLYRYSARQLRGERPEHDDYWGDDGELKTWLMAAEVERDYSPIDAAESADTDQSAHQGYPTR